MRQSHSTFSPNSTAPTVTAEIAVAGFTRDVKNVLREHGCEFFRQGKGDHEVWWNPTTGKKFDVDSDIKSRHTANAVMKQASIDHKF